MGVDARMFVRLRGVENWIKPEDVLPLSYELASTVGYDAFLITKGAKHSFGVPHHALTIAAPIKDAADAEYHGLGEEAIGGVVYTQDGDHIVADADEQFVEVHLMGRYYGKGYERGSYPTLRAIAEWLEFKLPSGEVWYGGDSSGMCATAFTPAARSDLNRHFLANGRRPYQRAFGDGFNSITGHRAPTCEVCEVRMFSTGGGQGRSFWSCDGCGAQAIVDKAATVHRFDRHKDIFEASREVDAAAAAKGD